MERRDFFKGTAGTAIGVGGFVRLQREPCRFRGGLTMKGGQWVAILFLLLGGSESGSVVSGKASTPTTTCDAMLALSIPDTELTSATVVPQTATIPAHCRIVSVTHGEPGSNVIVEVRLPDDWNGKLLFTTRLAFIGSLPAVTNLAISQALARHYAIVTTDSGHSNPSIADASFGLNNRPAEIDFGYRAVHLAKVVAMTIMAAYYGSNPVHSYYNGCSSSGRYAIQAAEHYPDDFDGIIAGAPWLDSSGSTVGYNWDMQAMLATPIPTSKLPVIFNAVTEACDGIDGLIDGLIDDPRECHFDPHTLLCPAGDAASCLTEGEVATLEKIYSGPSRSATATEDPGEQIYSGFPFGANFPIPSAARAGTPL